MEEIRKKYALIQWEDLLFTVIDTYSILAPRKDACDYRCGDYIKARYGGKVYEAVICDLNENKIRLNEIRDDPVKRNEMKFQYNPDHGKQEVQQGPSPSSSESADIVELNDSSATLKRKNTEQIPSTSGNAKKKCSGKDDEAKQEKLALAKTKRVREKERASAISTSFLNSNDLDDLVDYGKIDKGREEKLEKEMAEIKDQISTIYGMVESLLQCKSCLRKAYKKLDYKCAMTPTTPKAARFLPGSPALPSPSAALSLPPDPITSPVSDTIVSPDEPCLHELLPNHEAKTDEGKQNNDDDLVYLGEARFGVKLRREDFERAHKTAKTNEKLCLNLMEFLLTEQEMTFTTVYGNVQHQKKPMDYKKVGALKSHIMARCSPLSQEDFEAKWCKMVVSINNKIRKRSKN